MARIPTAYAARRTPSFSRPMAQMRGGAAVGQAVQKLGNAVGDIANASETIVAERARVDGAEAELNGVREINDLLYNPDKGFMVQTKRNAVNGYVGASKRLAEIEKRATADLDPRAAGLVKSALARRVEAANAAMSRHLANERRTLLVDTSKARVSLAGDAAVRASNDAAAFEAEISGGLAAINGVAKEAGWSAEELEANRRSFVSDTIKKTVLLRSEKDPVAALEFVRKNRDRMKGEDFVALERMLIPEAKKYEGRALIRNLYTTGGTTPPANAPRGIRNNNPGNIRHGPAWEGVTGSDGSFAQFQTPEHGIRAMYKQLDIYQTKHGAKTLTDIVSRWAPSSENDTASYIARVAEATGLDPDAEVDLEKDGAKLITAMIRHENGQMPYSFDVIGRGIAMAQGKAVAPVTLGVKTNKGMNPVLTLDGRQSKMASPEAGANLDNVIRGPFARLQQTFGGEVTINDAIAKAGSSRETKTKGSQHFHGKALDIDISKMSNEEKQRLVKAAVAAGFTGFGFGKNILHIDVGKPRSWTYGSTGPTFAGMPIALAKQMVAGAKGSTGLAPVKPGERRSAAMRAIESETDPVRRDAMIRELKAQESFRTGQAAENRAKLEAQAFEHVLNGGSPDDLPIEVKSALGRTEMSGLYEYHKKRAAGVPIETDKEVLYRLTLMQADDPKSFGAVNLMDYVDKLSPGHFDEMRKAQAKLRGGDSVSPKYGSAKEALKRIAPGTFDFNEPMNDGNIGERSHSAWNAMVHEFDVFVEREGRQPTERESMEMAARVTAKVTTREGFLTDYEEPAHVVAAEMIERFGAGKSIVLDGEEVTSEDMQKVIAAYMANGGAEPSYAQAIQIYRTAVRREAADRERAEANRLSAPKGTTLGPATLTAPDDGGAPSVGGPDVSRPSVGAAQSVARPSGADLRPENLPQTDGASPGIPPMPKTDDPVEWDFYALKVGIALQESDDKIRLGNGIEIDVFDWADARNAIGPDATPAQIVKALLGIDIDG